MESECIFKNIFSADQETRKLYDYFICSLEFAKPSRFITAVNIDSWYEGSVSPSCMVIWKQLDSKHKNIELVSWILFFIEYA